MAASNDFKIIGLRKNKIKNELDYKNIKFQHTSKIDNSPDKHELIFLFIFDLRVDRKLQQFCT